MADELDAGPDCISRTTSSPLAYTFISQGNSANVTGTVDSIKTWALSNITGLEAAAFNNTGGLNFDCNGNCNGAGMSSAAGSCVENVGGVNFTIFPMAVTEYAGAYWTGGTIERGTGTAYWYINSDEISNSNSFTATGLTANREISLLFGGDEGVAGLSIPVAMHHYLRH